MKILFDQGVPAPLRDFLESHTVATAFEAGGQPLRTASFSPQRKPHSMFKPHAAEVAEAISALRPGDYRELTS